MKKLRASVQYLVDYSIPLKEVAFTVTPMTRRAGIETVISER